MNKYIRLTIMIALVLGIVFVAQKQIAWAANSTEGTDLSTVQLVEKSVASGKDDCDKHKNRDKCKDKDKDKDKCKKNKHDCGTVKPPPHQVLIPVTGEYSVGGFCTLSVVFNDPTIILDASIETPLPRELPDKVHRVRQGCHLIYYDSGKRIDELASNSDGATICFATIPQQQTVVYFHNMYALHPTWVALETTVENGIACAAAPKSGVYVATFQTP